MTTARLAITVEARDGEERESWQCIADAMVSSRSVRPRDGRGKPQTDPATSSPDRNGHDWRERAHGPGPSAIVVDPGGHGLPLRKAPAMTIDKRNAAAARRARDEPEAVAALVDACGWLDAALAGIVEAGVKAGAFANPRAGMTWATPWRAAHARCSLVFRALARRCPVLPVPAAHSTAVRLDTLATLDCEPCGPSLLALVVERGSSGRAMRPAASGASSPSPAPVPVSSSAPVRCVEAEHSPSSEVRPVVQLLADARSVFAAKGNPERIASAKLDRALHAMPGRPWGAMPATGKPITPQARGRLLAAVGVRARTLEFDGKDAKGYPRAAFRAAWSALL